MTQQIKEQETQVKVIERRQEIELQEQVKLIGRKFKLLSGNFAFKTQTNYPSHNLNFH